MSFRLDRFATLYVARPLRWSSFTSEPALPILMYHSVSDTPETGVHPYYRTSTSAQRFAEHMECLNQNGYRSASLGECLTELRQERDTASKRVVITFDDGYRDFYQQAFPLLAQYGFSATVFLPTAFIGDTSISFKGKECLTWAEVRELQRHGMRFGSHTVTHPQLRELSPAAIREEVTQSKHAIEDKIGSVVESFAYPYAFPQTNSDFKKMLREMLNAAGYQNGVCTIVGRATSRSGDFFMERLPVNTCDDAKLLKAKLDGAYDWVGKTQSVAKLGKTYLRSLSEGAKSRIYKDLPAVQSKP